MELTKDDVEYRATNSQTRTTNHEEKAA
jgi:hypothetical protein